VRTTAIFLIYGVLSVLLQSTWLSFSSIPFHFNFLLPAVIFFGFHGLFRPALISVLVLGILVDCVSFAPLGVFLWTYLLLFLSIRLFLGRIISSAPLARFGWMIIFSLVERFGVFVFTQMFSGLSVTPPRILYFLMQTASDALLGLLLYPLLLRISSLDASSFFQPKGIMVQKR